MHRHIRCIAVGRSTQIYASGFERGANPRTLIREDVAIFSTWRDPEAADLVVFDFATVSERATYEKPNQTATGMRYVIVNGTPVIRDGELVRDARPGQAVRRSVTAR